MKTMNVLMLIIPLVLTACGGGGNSEPRSPDTAPLPVVVIAPPTTTTTVSEPTTTTSTTTTTNAPTTTTTTVPPVIIVPITTTTALPTTTTQVPVTTTALPATTTTRAATTTTTRAPTTTTRVPATTTTTRLPTTTTTASTTTTTSLPTPSTTTTTLNPAPSAPLRVEQIGDTWTYDASFVSLEPLSGGLLNQTEVGTLTKRVIGPVLNPKGTTCLVEETSGVITNTSTGISRLFSETTFFYQDQTGTRFYCGEIIQDGAEQVALFLNAGLLTALRSPLLVGDFYTGFTTTIYQDGSSYGTQFNPSTKIELQRAVLPPLGELNTYEVNTGILLVEEDTYVESLSLTTWINPEIGTVISTRERFISQPCQCVEDILITKRISALRLSLTGYHFVP